MRLIDADALYDLIDSGFDIDFDETPETKRELLRMVKEAPTIDAEPVRHGQWIKINTYEPRFGEYVDKVKCSECGCVEYFNQGWARFKYCPNCGAKMDEVNEE